MLREITNMLLTERMAEITSRFGLYRGHALVVLLLAAFTLLLAGLPSVVFAEE
jgi:hypothetical protein